MRNRERYDFVGRVMTWMCEFVSETFFILNTFDRVKMQRNIALLLLDSCNLVKYNIAVDYALLIKRIKISFVNAN